MGMAAASGSRPVEPMRSSIVATVRWNCGVDWARMPGKVIDHGQARVACVGSIARTAFGIASTPDQVDQLQGLVQR
jgi:hypothetical protein